MSDVLGRSRDLQVAVAEISPAAATVLVRTGDSKLRLSGDVIGPSCELSRTLTSRFPLRPLPSGSTWTSAARVIDPCFWSPALPAYYRVQVRLEAAAGDRAETIRWVGIRHLLVRGPSLYLEGRRWVVRGGQPAAEPEWDVWREHGLCLVADRWSADLLQSASLRGVGVVANLSGMPQDRLAEALGELAAWPAVLAAVLPAGEIDPQPMRQAAPNLLLAVQVDPVARTDELPLWADVYVADAVRLPHLTAIAHLRRPWWAVQHARGPCMVQQLRRACEQLQASLAPDLDLAGYLILSG